MRVGSENFSTEGGVRQGRKTFMVRADRAGSEKFSTEGRIGQGEFFE